jgi:hypothetical protein
MELQERLSELFFSLIGAFRIFISLVDLVVKHLSLSPSSQDRHNQIFSSSFEPWSWPYNLKQSSVATKPIDD